MGIDRSARSESCHRSCRAASGYLLDRATEPTGIMGRERHDWHRLSRGLLSAIRPLSSVVPRLCARALLEIGGRRDSKRDSANPYPFVQPDEKRVNYAISLATY